MQIVEASAFKNKQEEVHPDSVFKSFPRESHRIYKSWQANIFSMNEWLNDSERRETDLSSIDLDGGAEVYIDPVLDAPHLKRNRKRAQKEDEPLLLCHPLFSQCRECYSMDLVSDYNCLNPYME